MKQFFSVLFSFVFVSGLSFAQDAYDKAGVQTTPVVPIITNDPQYEAPAAVLYDNGPLVNAPGGGFGGADASVLQTALTLTLYGFGHQVVNSNSIADDFTVTDDGWLIDQMQFFAYQTGSTTTSTINDVRVQIWNGDPTAGGTVIWGDLTTNRLVSSTFSNIYRSIDTDPFANSRPVMVQTVNIGTGLAPGTYWVQWMTSGTLTSGPWVPPITINGQTTTGNGKQNLAGTWQNAMDGTFQQGIPFILLGTAIIPAITVTSPNGGENWYVGSMQNITWTSDYVANVRIYYSTDNGVNWILVANSEPSDSSYSWLIPNTPSTECKVRIRNVVSALEDLSDNVFTIYNITTPVLVAPANNSTEIPTNPELVWQSATGAETYRIHGSLSSDFSTATFEIGSLTGTSFSVSGLAENTKYFWRVRGESGAITGSWSDVWSFTTKSTINLNYTITFPSRDYAKDYKDTDYKILGLPGNGNIDVGSLFTGTQGTDWQVYWDNGDTLDYYIKYGGSNIFRFTTGKAYWIVKKGNLNININVTAVSLNTAGIVEIPLINGWTLITNPFNRPVQWSDVLNLNGLVSNTLLNSFNPGWATSTTLQPSVGYLFNNSTGLATLKIGYPIGGGDKPLPKEAGQFVWSVKINLSCDELIDHTTSFGVSKDASERIDKFDHKKPRAIGDIPIAYFYHPDWDDGYEFFATDFRPEFEDEQTWDVNVSSEVGKSVNLTFSGMDEISDQMEIYLVDRDRAKFINLRQESEYEFTSVKKKSEFQILVGKPELINSKLNGLLPTEFELGNNFPNPFNPTTTIPLSVPQTADIKLVIYNILGQEVRVLFDGTIEPGKYWYPWDGRDNMGQAVPSGIYLYNFFSSTGINLSKKMVLIK